MTDFYAVSAQILVVLILALTIEARQTTLKNVKAQTFLDVVMAYNQIAAYSWGVLGLVISMLRLGEFHIIGGEGGRLAVLFTIVVLIAYLLSQLLLRHAVSEKNKLFIALMALVLFSALPMTLSSFLINYPHPLDSLLIVSMGAILSVIGLRIVIFNKRLGSLTNKKQATPKSLKKKF